ncbi:MAG: flagellar hook protein FlgE [Diaphorobacter nitroreducens]|uniref:Flagellar hook protein FlgE n=3 Tax=Diaphorobacter TaxID=238749 RepID=A0AAX1WRF6_9BURK|nr:MULTISPECIES: flagellar hook protein FlgE [Diaphorobacter]UOB06179.1 flagellar hook protein FlgE [Diaphorobacter sp. LI3]ASI70062.1 flagellar biosynthesis protein FlgE [Diaphorobacter nitroreducens]MBV2217235.1 flagellar hook protein FlgE [Diaphorobacter sp.]ROR39254.1 flagellar hook protein FlgE [Diaphorobacter nitroreducens]WKK88607.1 flagellar hook protein FlgE [Diaphorobacter sp. C33]
MGFQQGLSGLNASAKNLDVIGHNIANANTTGFKASRTEFAAMIASAIGASSGTNSGIGVEVSAIAQQFNQGNLTVTGNSLDVAINGNGFFTLQMPDGSRAYTRAGNFKLDNVGNVVTNDGAQVMGYPIDPVTGLRTSSTAVPLTFPTTAPIPARQTTAIKTAFNLDARTPNAKGDPGATPPVAATPRTTYGTSLNVYDSQGVATPLSFYFEKNGANTWDIYNQLDDLTTTPPTVPAITGRLIADKNGAVAATLEPVATSVANADPALTQKDDFPTSFTYRFYGPDDQGVYAIRETTLSFTNPEDAWDFTYSDAPTNSLVASARLKDNLVDYAGGTSPAGGTFGVADLTDAPAAAKQSFELALMVNPSPANPNSPTAPGSNPAPGSYPVTLDLNNVTQFGTKFAVSELSQDGYTSGELTGINVENNGMIMTRYSNGVTRAEGQIALASFRNTQGLAAVGGNNWVETYESGQPVLGAPTDGNFGALRAGALEDSNVDLTAELVNMMTAQRAYQANAQTIKTQDQVMSTLVNLR